MIILSVCEILVSADVPLHYVTSISRIETSAIQPTQIQSVLHPCQRLRALALGAMPITAAVIGDLPVRAVLAAHDMAAESHRAATLDRRHHLQLAETDVTCIGLPPSRSMVAEDIRDLQGGTSHDRRGL